MKTFPRCAAAVASLRSEVRRSDIVTDGRGNCKLTTTGRGLSAGRPGATCGLFLRADLRQRGRDSDDGVARRLAHSPACPISRIFTSGRRRSRSRSVSIESVKRFAAHNTLRCGVSSFERRRRFPPTSPRGDGRRARRNSRGFSATRSTLAQSWNLI